jgi:hypothetical protein
MARVRELHLLHSAQDNPETTAASNSTGSVHSISRRKGDQGVKLTFTFIYSVD